MLAILLKAPVCRPPSGAADWAGWAPGNCWNWPNIACDIWPSPEPGNPDPDTGGWGADIGPKRAMMLSFDIFPPSPTLLGAADSV